MNDFNEPGTLAPTGLYIGGTKYMVIQGEPGAVIRGKKVTLYDLLWTWCIGWYLVWWWSRLCDDSDAFLCYDSDAFLCTLLELESSNRLWSEFQSYIVVKTMI